MFSLTTIALIAISNNPMVTLPSGEYRPLYLSEDSPIIQVQPFAIDTLPVTNQNFFDFVSSNTEWQKDKVPALFSEDSYLKHWHKQAEAWQPKTDDVNSAVVNVSWYSANAYCKSQNKRLPTTYEWEYVARASDSQADGSTEQGYTQKILDWYAHSGKRSNLKINQSPANYWGIKDLHGLIWEWTHDFNSSLVTGESRGDSTVDSNLYCAGGAAGAADPSDYAAFMRFGFRSSLKAKYTIANLGFRCAADVNTKAATAIHSIEKDEI